MTELPIDRVKELLNYNPETGVFTWRVNRGRRVKVGDVAGYVDNNYRKIRVEGRNYHASRLAFLLMTGMWPEHEVDHIDGDTSNNKWANLREATRAENQQNRTVRKDSFTNKKGVRLQYSKHGNKVGYYVAQIGINGKRVYLGSFKTAEEAAAAYATAAKTLHKAFSRT